MTTRLVLAPSAPSQASELGACPSVCFHGWKWSLTKTESNPSSSASTENSSNSRGPNCSADALYPIFSTVLLLCPGYMSALDLGQHVLAEAPHIGDDLIRAGAVKAEIDRSDAEILECTQIADDRVVAAGEQAAVAIIGLLGNRWAALRHAVGHDDFFWVAAGLAAATL